VAAFKTANGSSKMHESSIVESLIEQVVEELTAGGHAGPVTAVELEIGKMSGIHPEAIRFAFEVLSPNTPLAGATLTIGEPPAYCVCHTCHARTPVEQWTVVCPQCHGSQTVLEGGQEMILRSLELAD
jgi:hydrogenase nickel incorporation protein HypA/HybF